MRFVVYLFHVLLVCLCFLCVCVVLCSLRIARRCLSSFFVTLVLRVACWLRVMCFLFVVCGYAFVVVFDSCCLLFVNVVCCL